MASGGVRQVPGGRGATASACRMCGSGAIENVGEVKGYPFFECDRCAFTFTPAVTPGVLDELYASGYHGPEEGAPQTGWAKDEAEFLAPAFDELGPGPHRVLDFGTGQSRVPDILRDRGHRVVAVDVAPPLRPHPDRLTGDISDLDLPLDEYDLAYAYQVFEHLPEPRPVLDRLLDLTREGGLLLVHTDMEMPERDEDGFRDWWYVLPPDHNAFYRHRTFEVYCEGTPHEVAFADEKRVILRAGA